MRSKKEVQLLEALEVAAAAQGFDLVDLEFAGSGKSTVLRVYINKDEGLTIDGIAGANAWISEVVERLDPYKGSYTLEVSSPGIDRPLRTWRHFERAVGEEAVITLESAQDSRSNASGSEKPHSDAGKDKKPRLKYTGLITSVDPDQLLVTLEADGIQHQLGFNQIRKAKIKGRLDFESRRDS
ncbi:MAG: ribosome maturation factor RimP [Coriobacteriia bacterium]|nr:ribosome maturation factor RimP [Coriobacteriia bacterium]MCL2749928.1 ribosome maturation factor RimP [Coriobacteriia bacterium]